MFKVYIRRGFDLLINLVDQIFRVLKFSKKCATCMYVCIIQTSWNFLYIAKHSHHGCPRNNKYEY